MKTVRRHLLVLTLAVARPAAAVPPLVIGDAPTADRGHVEWYAGVQWEQTDVGELSVPASEWVLGVSDWQEVTVEAPYLAVEGQHGFGDVILGTKVRLLAEEGRRPGVAASLEWKLPNASRAAGLGTGASELELRFRGQKTWGRLTAIANAGYTLVGEPREGGARLPRRDTGFLGAGGEVEIGRGLTLLADAYWRSADVPSEPARVAGDLGLKLKLTQELALDAAIGRSLRSAAVGGPELRAYAGLKWEFGAARPPPLPPR
jgi:hypothetical protein